MTMNLKLFGIGALLRSEDGYTKIQELVPGGPAARSGLLKPGDRIIAVAQGTKEPVDIVNVPISHAVEMIRGPKGTTVTLTILPAGAADGAAPKKVILVRDEIKLEEQESKARILDWPTDKGQTLRLAVIDLPSFYAEMGGRRRPAAGPQRHRRRPPAADQAEGGARGGDRPRPAAQRRWVAGGGHQAHRPVHPQRPRGPDARPRGRHRGRQRHRSGRAIRRPAGCVDQPIQRLGLGDPRRRRAGLWSRRPRRRSGDLRQGHRADPHAAGAPDGPERTLLQL